MFCIAYTAMLACSLYVSLCRCRTAFMCLNTFSFPKDCHGCWTRAHAANTQVAVWCETGQVGWWQCAAPSPASFICYGSGQNAISCKGEARGMERLRGRGMQRTSKAPESYQELEYCQHCVPTRQSSFTLWCTRTSAMDMHTIHSVC